MRVTVLYSLVRSALVLVFSVFTELSSIVSFCLVALFSCCTAVIELLVLVIIFFKSFISLLVFILRILSWFNNCLSSVNSCTTSHLTWQALLVALPLPAYTEPVRTDRQIWYIHSPVILAFSTCLIVMRTTCRIMSNQILWSADVWYFYKRIQTSSSFLGLKNVNALVWVAQDI